MKMIILVLVVLLGVETWGVYGAAQAKHITVDCTLEIGPLCYAWEPNAFGKVLGDRAKEVEDAMLKARKAWEKDFVERVIAGKEGGKVDAIINGMLDLMKKSVDQMNDIVDKGKEKVKDATK
jgi:hypothetical protein